MSFEEGNITKSIIKKANSSSKSKMSDLEIIKKYNENFSKDVPEEFIDPILLTIMRDPVIISTGYVVDRSTVLDEKTGKLKFESCPWTRKPLKNEIHPHVERSRKLKQFKLGRLQDIIDTARMLLENQNFSHLYKLYSYAEGFLEDVGEGTHKQMELQIAKLGLAACEGEGYNDIPLLARILIRIYRVSLQGHNGEKIENNEELVIFNQKIPLLQKNTRKAITEGKFDYASECCEACDIVQKVCGDLVQIPVSRIRLYLGRKRGDTLITLQRQVYCEIRNDQEAVQRFCKEEGIELYNLRDFRPVILVEQEISWSAPINTWQCALESEPLEGGVWQIMVAIGNFKDRGWGYSKGGLSLALYDSSQQLVTRRNLFGTYCAESYGYVLKGDEDIVSMAQPNFTYKLEFTVGGGLYAKEWTCKIFYDDWLKTNNDAFSSYQMSDRGKKGRYIGPIDENEKANGRGRLEYFEGDTFIGDFSHGSMVSGVCYSNVGKSLLNTMKNGNWTDHVIHSIAPSFPLDANQKFGESLVSDSNHISGTVY